MAKRRTSPDEYIKPSEVYKADTLPNMIAVSFKIPAIVKYFDTSFTKQAQEKPDWSLYRIESRYNVPYIVREMCDRCGKVWIPPRWRKLREFNDKELGIIYFETGICKDCINASVYVDKYLDGEVLTETEAKKQFYDYAKDYERTWRMVIAAAPRVVLTEEEWEHRCRFFNGCAVCGGRIEVRAKYFPVYLNGAHTAWNVIPLCNMCLRKHYAGRVNKDRKVKRYRVFSTYFFFNKSKTIRLYLLNEMRKHQIYMEPLQPYLERFYETKILEGSE